MHQIFFNNVLIFTLYIYDIIFSYKVRNKKNLQSEEHRIKIIAIFAVQKVPLRTGALRKVKRKLGAKPKQCQLL